MLLSGNHARIARWRLREALRRTRDRRPDLLERRVPLARVGARVSHVGVPRRVEARPHLNEVGVDAEFVPAVNGQLVGDGEFDCDLTGQPGAEPASFVD